MSSSSSSASASSTQHNKPSFQSCHKSFVYAVEDHQLWEDFDLGNRPFGRHRNKHRATLINQQLIKEQLQSKKKASSRSTSQRREHETRFVVCVTSIKRRSLSELQEQHIMQEVEVAMKLRSSHLCTIYGYNNFSLDYLYIVEDFCGVGDFAMFRGLGLKWSERVLCKIAKDVLNGLLFLHKTGVAYEHLNELKNVVLNHKGKVKLYLSSLLETLSTPPPPRVSMGGSEINWAVAREKFESKRKRDVFDFAKFMIDLLELNDFGTKSLLRYFEPSVLMTDLFNRLCVDGVPNPKESTTLSVDILLQHPWFKSEFDKQNDKAMYKLLSQLKKIRQKNKKKQKKRRPATSSSPRDQYLALNVDVPLLRLHHELFEFSSRVNVDNKTPVTVGRVKLLVLQYYIGIIMLPVTINTDDFYFQIPLAHGPPVRLQDKETFKTYSKWRGRNGEYRLQLIEKENKGSKPKPPPGKPPHKRSATHAVERHVSPRSHRNNSGNNHKRRAATTVSLSIDKEEPLDTTNDALLTQSWLGTIDENGVKYYYNRTLDVSTWHHPDTLSEADLLHIKQTSKSSIEMQIKQMATAKVRQQQREQAETLAKQHDNQEKTVDLPVKPVENRDVLIDSMAVGQSQPLPAAPSDDNEESRKKLAELVRSQLTTDANKNHPNTMNFQETTELRRTKQLRPLWIDPNAEDSDEDDDDNGMIVWLDQESSAPPPPERPHTKPMTLGTAELGPLRDQVMKKLAEQRGVTVHAGTHRALRPIIYSKLPPAPKPEPEPIPFDCECIDPPRPVIAIFDNVPEYTGELAFDRGDVLMITAAEGGWLEGTTETGVVGWFSRNYCKPLEE